jgi:ABC-2 type transport system permease protein
MALNISKSQLDSAQINSKVRFNTLKGDVDSNAKDAASLVVGYISGFLIYIILFIYGTMVMRGVME